MDGHNQKLIPDSIMRGIFPEDNDLEEEPMFVAKCKIISNWNIGKDRVIILSTHYIYLLSTREIRKKVAIIEAKYFIKSLVKNNKEVLLFFREGFDLRLSFENTEEFFNILRLRYSSLSPKTTLKVYGVPQTSLKDYVAPAKKNSYVFDAAPEEQFRLFNEEIPGSSDRSHSVHGQLRTKSKQEQDPEDFRFEGRQSLVKLNQKDGDEMLDFATEEANDEEPLEIYNDHFND